MLRDRGDSRTEMKSHTVLFMDRAHHIADRRAHNTLHRALLRCNDIHLQAPITECGRHFQTDEARADHHASPGRGGARDQRIAVGERAEHVHMRQTRLPGYSA